MRELGRKGGQANGRVRAEQVPVGLREELRDLDPKVVRAAIEQTLAGGNLAAKVSAVKLLSDIDAFGKDTCPVCAKTAALDMTALRAKLDRRIEVQVEQRVEERLAALRSEHSTA